MTEYFKMQAPHPAIASTILLSQPSMGNNQRYNSQVDVIRMEDGSRQSYIRRGDGLKRHQWTFTLPYGKMQEFQDFIRRYRGSDIRVTWRGREIVGKCSLSPVEIRGTGREVYETTLELAEV